MTTVNSQTILPQSRASPDNLDMAHEPDIFDWATYDGLQILNPRKQFNQTTS